MRNKLVVAGAWGLFDHFLALEKYPEDGETICVHPQAVPAQKAFYLLTAPQLPVWKFLLSYFFTSFTRITTWHFFIPQMDISCFFQTTGL